MEGVPSTDEIKSRGELNQKLAPDKNAKYCPFSFGNPNGPTACGDQCKLYRQSKSLYCCPLQELSAISFTLRPRQ